MVIVSDSEKESQSRSAWHFHFFFYHVSRRPLLWMKNLVLKSVGNNLNIKLFYELYTYLMSFGLTP